MGALSKVEYTNRVEMRVSNKMKLVVGDLEDVKNSN